MIRRLLIALAVLTGPALAQHASKTPTAQVTLPPRTVAEMPATQGMVRTNAQDSRLAGGASYALPAWTGVYDSSGSAPGGGGGGDPPYTAFGWWVYSTIAKGWEWIPDASMPQPIWRLCGMNPSPYNLYVHFGEEDPAPVGSPAAAPPGDVIYCDGKGGGVIL